MRVADLLRSQFGAPSGRFGSLVVAPFLNFANGRLIQTTIDILGPRRSSAVLDIGFGPGLSLFALADRARTVVGVDHSRDMVDAARTLTAKLDNVQVEWGDVSDLPFADRSFDRVMSVNSLYYWPDLGRALGEIKRVLKPGGRTAIGFRSALNLLPFTLTWTDFKRYGSEEVAAAVRDAGFRVLRVEHCDKWRIPDTVVVLAERSPLAEPVVERTNG